MGKNKPSAQTVKQGQVSDPWQPQEEPTAPSALTGLGEGNMQGIRKQDDIDFFTSLETKW